MNDIQNSNNYDHIITLPSSTFATLPLVWLHFNVFSLLWWSVLAVAHAKCRARDLPTFKRRCSRSENKGCELLCHQCVGGCVAKALPVNLEYATV